MPDKNTPQEGCGFLLNDVARLLRRNFNRRVQALGLTQTQWRTLGILSRRPGISQRQLADILEMQPISVGRLLDRMQATGWIERRPDPQDRRALCLYLAVKADPILKEMKGHSAEVLKEANQGISDQEQKIFFDILTRMRANVAENE